MKIFKSITKSMLILILFEFLVPQIIYSDERHSSDYDYIIITHNNFYGSSEIDSLISFIESYRGFNVGVYYIFENQTNEYIKTQLIDIYDTYPRLPLYVLILGAARRDGGVNDHKVNFSSGNLVPGFYKQDYWDHRTLYDHEYITFDTVGSGFTPFYEAYPDMIIGRVPVTNLTEIQRYLDKLQSYEEHRYYDPILNPDTSWHNDILFVNGDTLREEGETRPGTVTSGFNHIISDVLPNEVDNSIIKHSDYSTNPAREQGLADSINIGKLIVLGMSTGANSANFCYMGGRPSFSSSDDLNNSEKLPLIIGASCQIGQSDIVHAGNVRSFVEDQLLGSLNGAIGIIGPSGASGQLANEVFS